MKQRKPWLVGVLGLVTLFIYSIIWWYKVQAEIKEETNRGIMAIGHIFIMLVPVVNIIYFFYWICTVDKNLIFLGAPGRNSTWAYLILSLLLLGPLVVFPMIQGKINSIGTPSTTTYKSTGAVRKDKYSRYFEK